ncbi:YrhK family protein [Halomonas sp. PR-M31]|uniref:YrhK family protein n=1 Tax=Halomonas sp. PR-M31 TaxID=1471202 RepID=UPI00069FDD9F|nr:YrhK family protein [Halomonas sp. PR-M31]
MPHLITHRPRVSALSSKNSHSRAHEIWQTVNAFSYKLGGLCFLVGSIFFFPALSQYLAVGDWLFFIGSILYLMVTGHDLLEVIKYWRYHNTDTFADHIEFVTAWSYVLGSALFIVGSLCFLPSIEAKTPGAWSFIIGSALFVTGGFVNIMQIVEAPSQLYMELFNITVAQFILGSGLFAVASIPYLWQLSDPADSLVTTLAASLFLFASILFFLGGILIYYRKLVSKKLLDFCHANGLGTMFISSLRQEDERARKKDAASS